MTSGATAISETVHDFLTLPGIAGFAVMEDQSPTFFCNIDGTLLPKDEAQFARNLSQVFASIPPEFVTIELHHHTYQTHLHRIDYATLLMVLLHPKSLERSQYQAILRRFMNGLREFRGAMMEALTIQPPSFASETSLDPAYPEPTQALRSEPTEFRPNPAFQIDTSDLETILQTLTIDLAPASQGNTPAPTSASTTSVPASTPDAPPFNAAISEVSVQAMMAAFNHLTRLAVGYLGKIIVGNQIKMSRPGDEWFLQFTIDTQAQLVINPSQWTGQTALTPEQHQLFQEWANQVMRATARVIRNFQDDVNTQLSPAERTLLFEASRRS